MEAIRNVALECGLDEQHEWVRPPVGGWTADDLDVLPNLPSHTELLFGSLIIPSPQTRFHMAMLWLLEKALGDQVPDHLEVIQQMTVKLDRRNRPAPDVLVVPVGADTGPRQTWFKPEDVVLAAEVVSEDSEERDREVKPLKYARAGIPHFWRVEGNEGTPVVHVFELDPVTTSYCLTGIHRKQLTVDLPFPIEIDLTAVNRC